MFLGENDKAKNFCQIRVPNNLPNSSFNLQVCCEDNFHRKYVFKVCSLTFPASSSYSGQNQPEYSS